MTSLRSRTLKGGIWLLGRQLATNGVRLITISILARTLSPADFGLAALAQVVLTLTVASRTNGVSQYIIHDREAGWERRAGSGFWLNTALTLGQFGLVLAVAPIAAWFYEAPDLKLLLIAVGATYVFVQITAVPTALIERKLNYRTITFRDTIADTSAAALSVIMALKGFGVWSLVLPYLFVEPARMVGTFWIARWIPSLRLGLREWRPIARYAFHIMGTTLTGMLVNDGDTFVIGRVLGARALGFYNLAWQLSNLVGRNITAVASTVALPALAMIKHDRSRLAQAYGQMLLLIAAVAFPLLVGMAVLADEAVQIVYGPGWEISVDLLRIFIVFTLVRTVTSPVGQLLNVLGRPEVGWRITLAMLPFYAVGLWMGSRYGLFGVAIAVMVVRGAGGIIAYAVTNVVAGLHPLRGVGVGARCLAVALAMGFVVWGSAELLTAAPLVVRLAVAVAGGVAVYFPLLKLFHPRAFRLVKDNALQFADGKRFAAVTSLG